MSKLGSIGGCLPLIGLCGTLLAQEGGTISGTITNAQGEPVHHAIVLLVQTGATVESDHDGKFRIDKVPPGLYDLFAEAATFTSQAKLVRVDPGQTVEMDLILQLSPIRESVTVTARGRHETTFEAVQSVHALEAFDLSERMSTSIGEVLEGELGVAKRSFGPGSSRPVVRGFDGDRVLILNDGMRLGSLGSQSGDHAEPIDPASLERLEVVKGPATLLYGSNAIGGVVNSISRHHEIHKHRHEGIRGQVTSSLGSNNGLAGANLSAEYGAGNWMVWAGGGGQRTGDYRSPEGTVENSKSRISNGTAGLGWFGDRVYVSGSFGIRDGRYGVPFAAELHAHSEEEGTHEHEEDLTGEELEAVDIDWQHRNLRLSGGSQGMDGFVENIRVSLNYGEWRHKELELLHGNVEEVGTSFENDQLTYRVDLDHVGEPFSGTFGVWGTSRDYSALGAEALSPPVDQSGFAVFLLEELNHEGLRLQFGGRLERISYEPKGPAVRGHDHLEETGTESEAGFLPEREFVGVSGSAGLRIPLWPDAAFVSHFSSSYRAPALEELYNFGPHVGNLAFEIGNPELEGERSNGIDLSLRHSGAKVRAEANFFFYHIDRFVFAAPTGAFEDGLIELEYLQEDSRFVGTELELDVALQDSVWITMGLDVVDAERTADKAALPRIPPLRSRLGMDFRYKGFSFRPDLVLASRQEAIFETETETAGYGVVNLRASYTLPRQHFVHHMGIELFNLGDQLYRNHLSLIKDLAPEMGRGVRVSYAIKFF